jgi:ubiquinone/menaquinone biosynthesis C-methylase UbiE
MATERSSYEGRHAQLYDLFYEAKDYASEARFVHDCLARLSEGPSRRVVDVACGTGQHALALERLGHEVAGIDHSAAMLEVARSRTAAAGARSLFHQGDLRALEVPGAPFDAATCLFDSIGYVATNQALQAAFRGLHRTVRPGGLLILEFWHAAAMLRGYDPVRVRRWSTPDGEVLRISETELDCERQLARVRYRVHEHRTDGTFSSFEEVQTNRYFLVQEMALWLTTTGFAPLAWFDGFSFEGAVSRDTWHVVGVARREAGEA